MPNDKVVAECWTCGAWNRDSGNAGLGVDTHKAAKCRTAGHDVRPVVQTAYEYPPCPDCGRPADHWRGSVACVRVQTQDDAR